jgi:selenide,water dikinase
VGNALADDAAVYRVSPGHALVQTIDFFTPVVDDPRLFGQIAAANALSDVYAMRARPVLALAFVAFPMSVLPIEVLEAILRGGAEKVAEAGAVVGGGHSIDHDVPLYGLSVTGIAEESRVTRNSGARPGDALVLTKPLGIGVTVCAGRADTLAAEGISGVFRKKLLSEEELALVGSVMATLNRPPVDAMEGFEIHAATDVTGYGLLGHLHEMMAASGTSGEVWVESVPLLPAARRLAARGIAPDGSRVNVRNMKPRVEMEKGVTEEDLLLVCDAQTSGGLLVALPEAQAEKYAARCRELGAPAGSVVGRVASREANKPSLRVAKERKESA